jgi:outer membrane protein assembly factor BamE (lipoprotein component of BamABCDE complex)
MRALRGLGKALKWTLLLGGLLILIIVIVTVVALGNASNDSEKSAKQVGPAKYRQAHQGMTKPQLRTLLGKPESTDETTVSGSTMECWYYGILAQSGSYQFCFSNGKLDSKSRY